VQDHMNDVLTNSLTIGAVIAIFFRGDLWYIDPATALLFSLYIIRNWYNVAKYVARSSHIMPPPHQPLYRTVQACGQMRGVTERLVFNLMCAESKCVRWWAALPRPFCCRKSLMWRCITRA
jgi:hypothetical protein